MACRPALLSMTDAAHGVALHHHVGDPAVEEHLHARLLDHLVHDELGDLGIGGRIGLAGGVVRGAIGEPRDATEQFIAHAAHHLGQHAVLGGVRGVNEQHQAAGPEAAEVAVAFDQGGLRAGPRGRHRRSEPGRSAADHQHIGLVHHGQRALGLDDFAAHEACGVSGRAG